MQHARDRITLGLALLIAVVSAMADSWLIAGPLMTLAMFLIFWGRAPQHTEAVVSRLPFGEVVRKGLTHLDQVISPSVSVPGDAERLQHVDDVWPELTEREKGTLKKIYLHGPIGSVPTTGDTLQRKRLVNQVTGGVVVRPEIRDRIGEKLKEEGLLT
ncbi:hypothetical protein [Methyloligella solikamskensis]|uniref:Uncharacterized protein n=1 Tax=Methyloligella solikamskensis TaxID=1177756 RepID=A0ABW3JA63_9HYPH